MQAEQKTCDESAAWARPEVVYQEPCQRSSKAVAQRERPNEPLRKRHATVQCFDHAAEVVDDEETDTRAEGECPKHQPESRTAAERSHKVHHAQHFLRFGLCGMHPRIRLCCLQRLAVSGMLYDMFHDVLHKQSHDRLHDTSL